MDPVDHALEVDRHVVRAAKVIGTGRYAPVDVGCVRVVADDADFGLVGAVIAMDR
jgi:hypothetical protein